MKAFKNIVYYFVGNLLPKASTFFLLPIYTYYLGPKEYGIVETMAVTSSILAVLFSLGIHNSVYRLFYDYQSEEERSILLGTINLTTFCWSIVFAIVLILCNGTISQVFNSITFFPYFFLAILVSLINNLGELPKSHLMLRQKALQYSLVGFAQFLITALLVLWYVVVKKEGASGMLKGQVFGGIFMLPYFIFYSLNNFKFKFRKSTFINIIIFSLPSIPTLISAWILNLSDRIFIEKYLSISDVGVYSLGYKIAGIIGFVFSAIDMTYMPYFFKLANSTSKNSLSKIAIINHSYNLILLFVSFSIALFSKEIVELFFLEKFNDAFKVIMIISYVYYFVQFGTILSKNLSQSKKVTQGMFIDIGIALLNIALNFLLIPFLGIYGAAFATLFSFITSSVIYYIYSSKHTFFVPIDLRLMLVLLTLSVILLTFLNVLINVSFAYLIYIKLILICSIMVVGYLYFRKHRLVIRMLFVRSNE